MDEELTEATLHVAATRPALLMGLPIELGALFIVTAGICGVLNLFYIPIMLPLWFGAMLLVRRDYNAPRVVLLGLRGPGIALDSATWGGASVSPIPKKLPTRYRGTAPDAW